MTATNLRLALQIQADLNQARQAVRNLGTDLSNTSESASDATQELENALDSAIREIQRLSGATDLQDGINELRRYERELDDISEATNEASESNQFLENSVRSLAPHLMALAGLSGGFVAMAVDTLNKAVELDRLAAFSTTGVEQFQYYAAGAKSAGVEIDSLAQIFKDARDKVGDFMSEGGGELQDFFDNIAPKVGVTAEQFKKLTGPEIMQLYVNTLREAGVSENEMITHMERIADDATVLLPLFEKNGEGFKKYGDSAKNAGAILDKDFIEKAKTAKGALGEFQNEMTGISYKLIANAAPAIVFVAQNLDVLAKAGLIVASIWAGKVASSVVATTISFVVGRIEAIRYQIALANMAGIATTTAARLTALRVASNLLTASGGFIGLAVAIAGVAASFFLLDSGSDAAQDALDEQKKTVAELAEEYRKLDERQQRVLLREAIAQSEKLAVAYRVEKNELLGLVDAIQHNSNVSEESKKKAQALFEQYRAGKITAGQLSNGINALKDVSDSLKSSIDNQAGSANDAATALNKKNQVVSAYGGQVSSAAVLTDTMSESIKTVGTNAQSAAGQISLLTKAHKELIQSAQNNTIELQYEIDQRKKGVSAEQASVNAKSVSTLNADPNSTQTWIRAPDDVVAANKTLLETQKELNDLNEKDKKAEEAKTKLKEKQAKIAEQTNKINKTVLAQSKKYNYESKEKNKGLPNGLLYAVSTRESGGNRFAESPVGAKGAFQFMPKTATRFGLNDRTDINASADAAAKYLKFLFVKFNGDLDKTIMAYNAGEGNVDSGKAYGFKETQQYLVEVKKNLAAYNGLNDENAQSNLGKMLSAQNEFKKQEEQAEQNKISIKVELMSEPEKLKHEYEKLVEKIQTAGFTDVEKSDYLIRAEQEYQDKLTQRPEILKRVNDSLQSVQQDFLKSSGRGLEADLQAAEDKYKQLKSDIAALMMTETDPVKQKKYQSVLVQIDYIIDKEQLTLKFNSKMQELEKLQSLLQQKQDTLKLQFDSGQVTQPQYAEGLKSIDNEMKPQLITLADAARDLAERLGDAFNVEKVNNFVAGLNQVDLQFKKFLPTADQLNERIASGLTDSIMDWADGTKSAGDAFREFASSFLREIAQMILKQMLFNAISQMGGASSGGAGGMIAGVLSSAFGGYATGGYTGAGGKYDPAGLVHKDEFVIRKESTSQQGAKEFLSHFNQHGMSALNKFKGYSSGGLVGAPNISIPDIQAPKLADPAAMIANSTSFSANQNFYLVDDPARILDVLKSGASQENLVVMMSRDPAKFKSALRLG